MTGLLLVLFATTAMAQHEDTRLRTITVSGEGTVDVIPDQATVRFGIVTRANDPETARQRNAEAAREAMNAVRSLGVAERKIQMQTLQLQPAREYNQETRRYEEVGFEAIREVVVVVEDLDTLPTLVAQVVQRGANRLNGIHYDLQDRDAVRDEALRKAVQRARAKAALMATTLGADLGPVLQIAEQGLVMPRPQMQVEAMYARASADQAAPEPEAYAAGEIEVRATVQVVFELK